MAGMSRCRGGGVDYKISLEQLMRFVLVVRMYLELKELDIHIIQLYD